MRDLTQTEVQFVTGAGCSPAPPSTPVKKTKNNNGFGNGPESGPAPGKSGATGGGKDDNFLAPKGDR